MLVSTSFSQSLVTPLVATNNDFAKIALTPSYIPEGKWIVFTTPLVGNTNLQLNIPFSYNDLNNSKGKVSLSKALTLLSGNRAAFDMSYDIFNLGFKTTIGFFTIGAGINQRGDFFIDKSLVSILTKGRDSYRDIKVNTTGFDFNAEIRSYISVGYASDLLPIEGLSVGGRLKLISGLAAVSSRNNLLNVYTSKDGEQMRIESRANIRFTGPFDIEYNPDGSIKSLFPEGYTGLNFYKDALKNEFNNWGLGLDFGATYKIDDSFKVSLSVLDLGFVRWYGSNSYVLSEDLTGNKAIVYNVRDAKEDGVAVMPSDVSDKEIIKAISNKLGDKLEVSKTKNETTVLYSKYYATLDYDTPLPGLSAKAVLGGVQIGGYFIPEISVMGAYNLFNWASASVSVSKIKDINPSVGLGLTFGKVFQFSIATSNVIGWTDKNSKYYDLSMSFGFGW